MIALRTILFFILTSLLSAVVGLCLVVAAHPGNPATRAEINTTTTDLLADKKGDIMDNFLDLGRNLVPDNLFQAAFETVSEVAAVTKSCVVASPELFPCRLGPDRLATLTLGRTRGS